MNLHDVADAGDPECFRGNIQVAENGAGRAVLIRALVGFLVEKLPLRREAVLRPDLLIMDKRALARAIEQVLERGEGDGVHGGGSMRLSYPSRNGLMISNPSMIWPCCRSSV